MIRWSIGFLFALIFPSSAMANRNRFPSSKSKSRTSCTINIGSPNKQKTEAKHKSGLSSQHNSNDYDHIIIITRGRTWLMVSVFVLGCQSSAFYVVAPNEGLITNYSKTAFNYQINHYIIIIIIRIIIIMIMMKLLTLIFYS